MTKRISLHAQKNTKENPQPEEKIKNNKHSENRTNLET